MPLTLRELSGERRLLEKVNHAIVASGIKCRGHRLTTERPENGSLERSMCEAPHEKGLDAFDSQRLKAEEFQAEATA